MRTLAPLVLVAAFAGCGTLSDKVDDLRSAYSDLKSKAQDVCTHVEALPELDDAGVAE